MGEIFQFQSAIHAAARAYFYQSYGSASGLSYNRSSKIGSLKGTTTNSPTCIFFRGSRKIWSYDPYYNVNVTEERWIRNANFRLLPFTFFLGKVERGLRPAIHCGKYYSCGDLKPKMGHQYFLQNIQSILLTCVSKPGFQNASQTFFPKKWIGFCPLHLLFNGQQKLFKHDKSAFYCWIWAPN